MAEGLSRRELLRGGLAAGAVVAVAPSSLACFGESDPTAGPRTVIVGAGLAGLSCAYRLQQAGLDCSVYEANPDRLGGRCWTAREFEGGPPGEHGAP